MSSFAEQVAQIVGAQNLILDEKQRISASKDSYHFSPVLVKQLDGKTADVIARPQNQTQLAQLIACAVAHRVPITPRGAGTGNYGQGVPLAGGLMISTRDLNNIIAIDADSARAEAGVILYDIERAAAAEGAELRCFPSTIPTSHTGGFITGGSGGVGSIEWGMLREADNVRHARILTIEETPRVLDLPREALNGVLHNCGLTCFVSEVTLGLAPKTAWHQYVIAFDDFYKALEAGTKIGNMETLRKRLLTAFEWPVPSFFVPLAKKGVMPEGASVLFLYTDESPEYVAELAASLDGRVTFHEPPGNSTKRGTQIYDYTWNHTTQWAMKADPAYTYLQDRFVSPERAAEQIRARKEAFPEVLEHVEFTKSDGQLAAGGLSLVRFESKERLWALIDWCETHDIRVANPHTHYLDEDTRWYGKEHLERRAEWDPYGLLNPGHLLALEGAGVSAAS